MKNAYIIAEAGVNHNGNLDLALEMVDVAADAGADAIKFQTFSADELVSISAPKAAYQKQTTDASESQYEMLKKLELSHENHFILQSHCNKKNIDFLSTPFDCQSAEFLLNKLKLFTIKMASGEITNAALLLKIARSKVNIILSTGMSTISEIEDALSIIAFGYVSESEKPSQHAFLKAYIDEEAQKLLQEKVTLLHCTSNYPAAFDEINLLAMNTLQSTFHLKVGYSDHTLGIAIPIAAVARGASIIEKHFTLDRSFEGPDHQASLEPHELKNMVQSIRAVEIALGKSIKIPSQNELETKRVARKSLIAKRDIVRGEPFSESNLAAKRPNDGISSIYYWDYINRMSTRNYKAGELIYE